MKKDSQKKLAALPAVVIEGLMHRAVRDNREIMVLLRDDNSSLQIVRRQDTQDITPFLSFETKYVRVTGNDFALASGQVVIGNTRDIEVIPRPASRAAPSLRAPAA